MPHWALCLVRSVHRAVDQTLEHRVAVTTISVWRQIMGKLWENGQVLSPTKAF